MHVAVLRREKAIRQSLFCLLFSVCAIGPAMAQATGNRATFPDSLEGYVNYATFHHGSLTAEALATDETLASAKSGQTFPPGTRLVLKMYTRGKHSGFFVMEKGMDWGLASSEEERTGDWHFQQFGTHGQVQREAIADRCQSCHGSQAANDFVFTLETMRASIP